MDPMLTYALGSHTQEWCLFTRAEPAGAQNCWMPARPLLLLSYPLVTSCFRIETKAMEMSQANFVLPDHSRHIRKENKECRWTRNTNESIESRKRAVVCVLRVVRNIKQQQQVDYTQNRSFSVFSVFFLFLGETAAIEWGTRSSIIEMIRGAGYPPVAITESRNRYTETIKGLPIYPFASLLSICLLSSRCKCVSLASSMFVRGVCIRCIMYIIYGFYGLKAPIVHLIGWYTLTF